MATRHGRRYPSALVTAVAGRRIESVGSKPLDLGTGGHGRFWIAIGRFQMTSARVADQSWIGDAVTECHVTVGRLMEAMFGRMMMTRGGLSDRRVGTFEIR